MTNTPIYCDECPTLALALYDNRYLCLDCLLAATGGSFKDIERSIIPLPVQRPDAHLTAED